MAKPSRTLQCSNKVMPVGLTEAFKERLMALSSYPKSDYLKAVCFSKFVSIDTVSPEIRRQRAIDKWLSVEVQNELTNERLISTPADYHILPRVPLSKFTDFCRDLVIGIIGDTVPEEALIGSFSGGASTSRNRTESHPAQKYLGKAHATDRALQLWNDLILEKDLIGPSSQGSWFNRDSNHREYSVVRGNVLFTVPKKTDIDRCACKEPDVNMFMQKGAGNFIRRSLRRIGINLNDQSINQSLALKGSLDNTVSTLDLSSASDSVATELVALLLPVCWYNYLDTIRCHTTIIDGELHTNEMFSSMGNGFTFELESLLFYVLTRACCYFMGISGIVSIYGDDIICPRGVSHYLVSALRFFGFSTNAEKSFIDGPFRESCGGHYMNGRDITPFFVKGPLTRTTDVLRVANQLRAWGDRERLGVIDDEVEDIWLWLRSYVPSQLWGGDNLHADTQLVSNHLPCRRLLMETKQRRTGLGGYYHWLNATWDRRRIYEGVETSEYLKDRNIYRLKRVLPTVPRLSALFSHEMAVVPSMERV